MNIGTDNEDCDEMFRPFIAKDFSHWKPWKIEWVDRCLEKLLTKQAGPISGFSGMEHLSAQFYYCKAENYSPTIRTWFRSGKFLKLEAEYPDINLFYPDQFEGLGDDVNKMTYSFGGFAIADGEWVYPQMGISFFFNGDYNRIIKIVIFIPATIEKYISEIKISSQVREF